MPLLLYYYYFALLLLLLVLLLLDQPFIRSEEVELIVSPDVALVVLARI